MKAQRKFSESYPSSHSVAAGMARASRRKWQPVFAQPRFSRKRAATGAAMTIGDFWVPGRANNSKRIAMSKAVALP